MNQLGSMIDKTVKRVAYLLILGISAKLLIDTTIQLFNPFLTMIAAGVGVSAVTMGAIVSLRGIMGLSSPLMGVMADRIGYKKIMQGGLFLTGIGMITAGLSHNVLLFSAAVVITGIGQAGYTPNLHAYLSTKLSYNKRAMGIGIVEYSWALAGILGLFLAGYLIEEFSWRAPFLFFGTLLVIMAVLYQTLPVSKKEIQKTTSVQKEAVTFESLKKQAYTFFHLGPHAGSAWGTIIIQGLNMFAIMHVMIIHGGWLSSEYGLDSIKLGKIAFLFGLGDLFSSVLVSIITDKIGKRKSVLIGVAGMSLGFVIMPFLNVSLYPAIISILIPRLFFEFATVSNLALLTGQAPSQRGKVMSLSTAVGLVGITTATVLGPINYYQWGVTGLAVIGFIPAVVSLFITLYVIQERE